MAKAPNISRPSLRVNLAGSIGAMRHTHAIRDRREEMLPRRNPDCIPSAGLFAAQQKARGWMEAGSQPLPTRGVRGAQGLRLEGGLEPRDKGIPVVEGSAARG